MTPKPTRAPRPARRASRVDARGTTGPSERKMDKTMPRFNFALIFSKVPGLQAGCPDVSRARARDPEPAVSSDHRENCRGRRCKYDHAKPSGLAAATRLVEVPGSNASAVPACEKRCDCSRNRNRTGEPSRGL